MKKLLFWTLEKPDMPKGFTYEGRKDHYQRLWDTCELRPEYRSQIAWHVEKILKHRDRYNDVQIITGVPWWFVGVIHAMEASYNFTKHLHNGDPLSARTRRVPKNRPVSGVPPFTWSASACDALEMKNFHLYKSWTVPEALYRLEIYNGTGYALYRGIETPYLWSYTNHYSRGKYVSDGRYDPQAVSKQAGACAILKALAAREPSVAMALEPGRVTQTLPPLPPPAVDPVEDELDLEPQPKAEPVPPTRREMSRSRKWNLLEWFKWIMTGCGLGGMSVNLGSASGIAEVKGYADIVTSFSASYGLIGFIGICLVGVVVALTVQQLMAEDVKDGRYTPSGDAR